MLVSPNGGWRVARGKCLLTHQLWGSRTVAFTKQSFECSLTLMSSAASCSDRCTPSLSSSFGRMASLLLHCLCDGDDAMLDLQRFQTTLHRACRAQPNFPWLRQTTLRHPLSWCSAKLFVATKEPLQLPLGGSKFSCPTRFFVVNSVSRVAFLERRSS